MTRISQLAPSARTIDADQLLKRLEETLRARYALDMLSIFTVFLEGWTDVGYLELAAKRHKESTGVDLLEIPLQVLPSGSGKIAICTPGRPGDPSRGGVPQMVRLANDLSPYVFATDWFKGLLFVFDHDKAGIEAAQQVAACGFKPFTLDPKHHPDACASHQVVIEDLLSLGIQRRYFDSHAATCSAEYEDGRLRRFVWGHKSKPLLRDFVNENAAIDDLVPLVRLLNRIRDQLGLPTETPSGSGL